MATENEVSGDGLAAELGERFEGIYGLKEGVYSLAGVHSLLVQVVETVRDQDLAVLGVVSKTVDVVNELRVRVARLEEIIEVGE